MHKKVNTAFLILAATILNVILMSLLFLVAYGAYHLVAGRFFSPGVNIAILFLLFVASVAATYFIHKTFLRVILKKTRIGKYVHPALLSGGEEQKQADEPKT